VKTIPTSHPDGPDPKDEGAIFLGWLKKRGGMSRLPDCERKCMENGFQAKKFIKEMGETFIGIYVTRGGEKVIKLENLVWADQWMILYKKEVPHHRHWTRL
jgi:hypothetical protein